MTTPGTYAGEREAEKMRLSRERPISEVVKDIMASAQEVIRSEMRLAKIELREEARKAWSAAGMLIGAGFLGLFGAGFLLAAIASAIALALPMWASLLIVTGGLLLAAGALFLAGRRRWAEMHKPEKTLQSVRENVEWLKHPTRS